LDVNMFGEDSDEDGDGEEGEEGEELEDIFSFDLKRVAEALRNGADKEELAKIIEDLMGDELETRVLGAKPGTVFRMDRDDSGTASPAMSTSLSGLMTPTADDDDDEAAPSAPAAPSPEAIGKRIGEVFGKAGAVARHRRSSIKERRQSLGQHPKLASAIDEVTRQRRRSLCETLTRACEEQGCAAKGGNRRLSREAARRLSSEVRRLSSECRRSRLSLLKAAETLEVAGIGVEEEKKGNGETADVSQQLCLVQDAMETARQRHRLSVARAVRDVVGGDAGDETEGVAADARPAKECAGAARQLPCQTLSQDKVQRIIAKAYAKHQELKESSAAAPSRASKKQKQSEGGMPEALVRSGTLVALMNARVVDADKHIVHIGPYGKTAPSKVKRRGR